MRARSAAGFTLIELLCALAVLAVVMAVALRILSGSSTAVAAIAESQTMVALAESHLAEMMVLDQPAASERDGKSGPLTWRETITPANEGFFEGDEKIGVLAWQMEVTVVSPAGRQFQLRSIRLVRTS